MIDRLPAPNVALIGFMATGKTSVGRILSLKTGLPFRDVDDLIEASEGMTIAEIFSSRGEAYFREREGLFFRQLCAGIGQFIGCGGGTLLDPENMILLRSRCFAVCLRASVDEIVRRIAIPGAPIRPLARGDDTRDVVTRLLRDREGLYEDADLVIDTDGRSIEEISDEIRLHLGLSLEGER